jgi:hypothetical protein
VPAGTVAGLGITVHVSGIVDGMHLRRQCAVGRTARIGIAGQQLLGSGKACRIIGKLISLIERRYVRARGTDQMASYAMR